MDKEKDIHIAAVGDHSKSAHQLLINSLKGEKVHPTNNGTGEICYIREHEEKEHEEKTKQLLVYCPEFLEGIKFKEKMQEMYEYIKLLNPPIFVEIDENGHITSVYMVIPKDGYENSSCNKLNISMENLITHPKEIEIKFSSHPCNSKIIDNKSKELLSKFSLLKEEK